MTAALRSFYFHDPRVFVLGIEHLTARGMSDTFAGWLAEEHDLGAGWVSAFNRAFGAYEERTRALSAADPEVWFPPRRQNVCVVLDAARTRPYYLPFHKASWLLYADDFAPDTSDVELGAYLFCHTERLCLTASPAAAVAHNLGYWLLRSEAERRAFAAAAARSTRPDAAAFQRLAEALPWIAELHHERLRPLEGPPTEPMGRLPHTGLIATAAVQPKLFALVEAFRETTRAVAAAYFAGWEGAPAAATVTEWLRRAAPNVLVTGEDGAVLWDPATPSAVAHLEQALGDIVPAAAESMRADLEVIDGVTRRFFGALAAGVTLPLPGGDIEQSGLTYIHATRGLVAYNVAERDMHRSAEPAAPYERLMLAARTMHEWGHLAVDAGLVRVAPAHKSAHARAELAFVDALRDIVRHAPPELAAVAEEERARTGASDLATGLKDTVLGRMPDFMANVLARRLLSPAEMETYVRQQVTSLAQENLGPFGQLARYAYEIQYLALSAVDDPMGYLLSSTWFDATFLEEGIVTRERFEALVAAMRRICDCFEIDGERVRLPP